MNLNEKESIFAFKIIYNGHLQTIYPSSLRRIKLLTPHIHERIITQDQDFLDLF